MSAQRFNDEQARQIGEEYLSGLSLRTLARKYDCPPTSIRNTIRRIGVSTRDSTTPKFWTKSIIDYVIDQYSKGRTQQSIAEELGIDQTAISTRLRNAGIRKTEMRKRPNGGRHVLPQGYVYVIPSSEDLTYCTPNSTGYVLEHRLVMARYLGRPLSNSESVHHINGDRGDNRLENLQLRSAHHGKGVNMQCNSCGSHDIIAIEL